MPPLYRIACGLIVLAILVGPKPVRGQDFSGTYTAEVPVRIENRDGVESVAETATATLTLRQNGQTVTGTWQVAPGPDRPSPQPRAMHGTVHGGRLVLTDTTEAQVRRAGEVPVSVRMIHTMELSLDGDTLTGTQTSRSVDGTFTSLPRTLRATRTRL